MRTIQEQLSLLDETVKYYSADTNRRAIDNNVCIYKAPNGNMCAIGRCLNKSSFQSYLIRNNLSIANASKKEFQFLLKNKYRGFSMELWENLQNFHDNCMYWDSNGLTSNGIQRVEVLQAKINQGIYSERL